MSLSDKNEWYFGKHIAELITIESVDSICRDGMNMQYIMKIQNLQNSTFISLYNYVVTINFSSVFMTKTVVQKTVTRVLNQKATKWSKMLFL